MDDDDLRARIMNVILTLEDPNNPQWVTAKAVDIGDTLISALGWQQEVVERDGVVEHRFVTGWRRD